MLPIFSKPKKLIDWSNSSTDNSCSPSLSKNSNKKINYKINNIPEALNIQANFNNKNITVTIDTGANICCIRHSLVPKTQTLRKENIQLSGPDSEPLTVFGSTIINITINDHKISHSSACS